MMMEPSAVLTDAPLSAVMEEDRKTGQAILRGYRRQCPNCGQGHLLAGYLKVNASCAVCNEEFHHHRADDGPAYLTILIVGHLLIPFLSVAYTVWRPDPLLLASILTIGVVGLSLYLLPRLKGAFIALQWAKRMHGFGTPPAP